MIDRREVARLGIGKNRLVDGGEGLQLAAFDGKRHDAVRVVVFGGKLVDIEPEIDSDVAGRPFKGTELLKFLYLVAGQVLPDDIAFVQLSGYYSKDFIPSKNFR